jgi:TP901 family phage tail tape measure protein
MSIEIPIESSGEDGVNRLIGAVDRLHKSLDRLAENGFGSGMKRQLDELQSATVTGLKAIELQMSDFGTKVRAAQKQSDDQLAAQAERARDRQLNADRTFRQDRLNFLAQTLERQASMEEAAAAASWKNLLSIEAKKAATIEAANARLRAITEKRDIEEYDMRASASAKLQALIEKRDLEEYAARSAGAAALRALIEKRDAEEYALRSAASAKLQSLIEKRDLDEYTTRSRDAAKLQALVEKRDLEEYNERSAAGARMKALTERQQLELYQIKASAQEKERTLNTKFLTSTIASQLATAEQAAVYAAQGGNASMKFGSAAASADIAELRRQYQLLPNAINGSRTAIESHNHVMNEAHALARGLSGSLGGLWLTYGSLVPLAAGAAIAGSLKSVVEVGKDVEYQLQFVAALSKEAVPIDQFLKITEGTVVGIKDAAEGMRALAQNGLSVKESLSVLPAVLNLSVIGELGVEAAALAATGALSAFNLEITDIGRVGDILAQTAASSNTSVRGLTESLKQGSVAASLYHVSIEETTAALGTLAKINITGAAAGTAYNNLLTSLYAPTAMASRALKQLGVEAKNTDGSLKNSSVLLHELRDALSGYNETQQARLIGDITTNRGAKAVATLLQYLDTYDKKVAESKNATGFMTEAVMKLEDTTEGAFRRLSNSSSRTLVRAFSEASPALQSLVDQLAHIAGSSGAVTLISNLANMVVRLTTSLVDNIKTIGLLVGAYSAFKLMAGTWASITAAVKAYEVGMIGATTSTAAFGLAARGALGVLGPIALAVTAVTVAWTLYTASMDKQETAAKKLENSITTRIDLLKQEREAIEARNEALDKEAGVPTVPKVSEAKQLQDNLTSRIASLQAQFNRGQKDGASDTRQLQLLSQIEALNKALDIAKVKSAELDEQMFKTESARADEADKTRRNNLLKQLSEFAERGKVLHEASQKTGAPDPTLTPNGIQSLKEAAEVSEALRKGTLLSLDEVQHRLNVSKEMFNNLLKGAPDKVTNDQLQRQVQLIALEKQLFDIRSSTEKNQLDADRASGEIGELGYLRQSLVIEKDRLAQAAMTALADAQLMADQEKKTAALQKYQNLVQTSFARSQELSKQELIAEKALLAQLDQENLKTEADTYKQKGDLLNAFLVNYEATYGKTIKGLKADLDAVNLSDLEEALFVDPTNETLLVKYNLALAETARLKQLASLKTAGVNDAIFGTSKQSFDAALAAAQGQLEAAKAAAAADGGLAGALGLEAAAVSIYNKLVPGLAATVAQMRTLAEASDDMDLKGKAEALDKSLQKLQGDLVKSAQPFGNAWSEAWKGIEKGAHDAWMNIGKGGESVFKSIGKVIKTSIMETLYQLTVKKWIISIGAEISSALGASNGGAGVLGGLFSGSGTGPTAGAGGGIGSLIGAVNAAKNIYSAVTGGIGASIGGGVASLGTMLGSGTLQGIGMGLQGAGTMSAEGVAYLANNVPGYATGQTLGAAGGIAAGVAGGIYGGRLVSGGYSAFGGSGNGTVNTGTAVGAIVGSVVPVIGTAIGSLVGGLLGGAVNRLFGHKPKEVTSEGIRGTLTETAVSGISYQDWIQKGGWFRSDKKGTETSGLTSEFQNSLVSGYANLKAITEGFGQTLGVSADALKGYTKSFDIKLDPKDATKTTEALTQFFTDIGNELATKLVPNISEFAKVGETASTTLQRLATDFKATDVVAQLLGKTGAEAFGAAGLASAAARENFINLSGGLDTLNANITSYAQNYLTEAEKMAPVAKALDAALAGLSLTSIPKTRDEFKNLVQGLDLTDATQVKLFNSLMELQGAFAQVHAAAESAGAAIGKTAEQIKTEREGLQSQLDEFLPQTEKLAMQRAALDESNRALFDQIQAQKESVDKLEILSQLYAATGNAAGAASVLEQQRLNTLKGLTPELASLTQQLWAAQAASEAAAAAQAASEAAASEAAAAASDVKDKKQALVDAYKAEADAQQTIVDKLKEFQKSVTDLAKSLQIGDLSTLNPEQKLSAARANYEDVLARATSGDESARNQLGQAAQDYLTANRNYNASGSQYNADAMRVQADLARLAASAGVQITTAEKGLQSKKTLVSKLVHIDAHPVDGFTKVQQAILDLAKSQVKAQQPAPAADSSISVLTALYQQLLGRAPDAAGVAFWQQQINQGASVNSLIAGIKNSPEYLDKTYGTGTSGINQLFMQLLKRPANAGDLAFWLSRYNSGQTLDQISAGIKQSPEYAALQNPHEKGGLAVGPSMINEEGPEFVDFTSPGRVYTAEQTAGMFAPRDPRTDQRVVELLSEILLSTQADKVQRAAVAEQQAQMMEELKAAQEALTRATRAK